MDGIHDLGGMEGFGPLAVTGDEESFRDLADWEKRMWGLAFSIPVSNRTIDWFRHGIECMRPADYLNLAYLNKWCCDVLMMLIDNGVFSLEDIKRGHLKEAAAPPAKALTLAEVMELNRKSDDSFEMPADGAPAFKPADRVRTLRHMPSGHTRLPRYARDAVGTVTAYHGAHSLPDAGAKGEHLGEHLYTVSFAAQDLWGPESDSRDRVAMELWESYLVPA